MPGIGGGQDTIEYGSHTHHTNLDSFERILPDDVKKNAIITASLIYHMAMRDQIMPRFPKEQMPPRPAGREAADSKRHDMKLMKGMKDMKKSFSS